MSISEKKAIARYMGTEHKILGVSSAVQHHLAKKNYFLESDLTESLLVYDEIFKNSDRFEIKNAALLFAGYHHKKIPQINLYKVTKNWVNYIDNWGHSDYLSKIYTRFLEHDELKNSFLLLLKKWNTDNNLWKRRQSLVALLYYSRTKKKFLSFNILVEFIRPLLADEEYFVQKGIGWTLREIYNVYPELTFKFAVSNFNKITSVAFSAACEKMTEKEKTFLKNLRIKDRKKAKSLKNG